MQQVYSRQFLRKRKFLLVLPLLVLPFITLAFWSMGGGTGPAEEKGLLLTNELNASVPDANFQKEKPMDKMQAYALADRDSNRLEKMMKQDPYYRAYLHGEKEEVRAGEPLRDGLLNNKGKLGGEKEKQLLDQLNSLQQALASEEPAQQEVITSEEASPDPTTDKVLAMIDHLNSPDDRTDPQMNQLNEMLDKIMRIQDRASGMPGADISANATTATEMARQMPAAQDDVDTEESGLSDTGFWGLEETPADYSLTEGIRAVIAEEQTIVNGAVVKMRLLDEIQVGKMTLQAGAFIYGKASLNQERLKVEIPTVKAGTRIISVQWKIYDMDGLEGIYMPGSIDREVIQQSGSNGLQSLDLIGGINPSLSMQAASLGIQTAKTLVGKKTRLVRLHLKPGYQVLIRDMAGN